MKRKKNSQQLQVDYDVVEKWLKDYFLDPHTTHCDLTQFKIDLYETENHWIVESLLTEYVSSDITVKVEENQLVITAEQHLYALPSPKRMRTISFPFPIVQHKVDAKFHLGVLEIYISKTEKGLGNNRYITLP